MASYAAGPDTPRGGDLGLSVQRASRELAAAPGFLQALRDQRASVMQFAQLWPNQIRIEKRGTQNILRAVVARAHERPQRPRWAPRIFAAPQEPQAAPAPRPQEPEESRDQRNARLDALLAANRANMEAAKERAKQQKNALLTQLRASRPP